MKVYTTTLVGVSATRERLKRKGYKRIFEIDVKGRTSIEDKLTEAYRLLKSCSQSDRISREPSERRVMLRFLKCARSDIRDLEMALEMWGRKKAERNAQ